MKLIKKIEINYLRSLYGATLSNIGDLNVVFGRNDSGKSNLLRALNLFFNGKTDASNNLDFDIDMSDRRKQEARDAKGRQFIWIKITFSLPSNYKASLGEEISIKRQWNRDGGITETVFPALETPGQQARLTRFVNDIDFSYIPAIKDLNVYADLIERMYGAAAETEVLSDATNNFVEAIAEQTTALSEQLTALFGAPAKLAPPTEMSRLFRNLDFAHGSDGHSMLRQKGDGVKARHLPELIRFINHKEPRKKIFIWGFEEPENSLDLGAAEEEAKRFSSFASRDDTQIFVTSHSPAFYLANGDGQGDVRRYFITKQIPDDEGLMVPPNAATLINDIEDAERKMEQAGLLQLPFVIRQLSSQREALKAKEFEAESLRTQLQKLKAPTLFVEGVHDVALFENALARLGWEGYVGVKPLGGTPQTVDALLAAVLEQGGLFPAAKTLFLFDDDKAGRGAARKMMKTSTTGSEPSAYGNNTFVWVLERTEEFKSFMKRKRILSEQAFFTSEFLYPAEEAAQICLELIEDYNSPEIVSWRKVINGEYFHCLKQETAIELATADPGTPDWFYARGVPDSLKKAFAAEALDRELDTTHLDSMLTTALAVLE